jgi:drug/metabolite transporter (DMT)-like permease
MVEPIVAITLGWVLLGQSLTFVQGCGIAIVLTCVVASERARSRALAIAA